MSKVKVQVLGFHNDEEICAWLEEHPNIHILVTSSNNSYTKIYYTDGTN